MARGLEYRRYTDEFKAKAVALSQVSGVRSKDVAESLDIHPLMLSRCRKESREGKISVKAREIKLEGEQVAELKRLRRLEQDYNMLKDEHALSKKAIQLSLERIERPLSS